MEEHYLIQGCRTITTSAFTITVILELTNVSNGKSKKKIEVFFNPKYGTLIEGVITPKRSSNSAQALAAHIGDWLICQGVEFVFSKKIAWAIARKFEQ